jgi:hypothetical protein
MDIGNKDNFIHDRDLRCDGNIDVFKFTVEEFFGKDIEGITQIYQPGVEIDGEDYFATTARVNYIRNLDIFFSDAKFLNMSEIYNKEGTTAEEIDIAENKIKTYTDDYINNHQDERFFNMPECNKKDMIRMALLDFIKAEKYSHIYYIQEKLIFNPFGESSLVFEYLIRGIRTKETILSSYFDEQIEEANKSDGWCYYFIETDVGDNKVKMSMEKVKSNEVSTFLFKEKMKDYMYNIEDSAGSKYPRFRNIKKETENDN